MDSPPRSKPRDATRLARAGGFAVLFAYAVIARLVGNFYPFSTFPMYAAQNNHTIARLGARGRDGALHDVEFFVDWTCPTGALETPFDASRPARGYGYIDRESEDYVRTHARAVAAARAEPVDLVNRTWHFSDHRALPEVRDDVIGSCVAVRGGGVTTPVAIDAFHPPQPRPANPR